MPAPLAGLVIRGLTVAAPKVAAALGKKTAKKSVKNATEKMKSRQVSRGSRAQSPKNRLKRLDAGVRTSNKAQSARLARQAGRPHRSSNVTRPGPRQTATYDSKQAVGRANTAAKRMDRESALRRGTTSTDRLRNPGPRKAANQGNQARAVRTLRMTKPTRRGRR